MDSIVLGKFILQRRKALDLGQKELSDALFVSVSTISKWEKGSRFPDLALIGELAKILKVDIESLCNLKEELNNTYDVENEFNIKTFSKHFKYLRKINDISLQDLGEKLGIRYQTISKWENCESLPSIVLLIECAKILNVSIAELYYGKNFDLPIKENSEVNIDNKLNKKYKITNITLTSIIIILIICLLGVSLTKTQDSNEIKITYDFDEFVDDFTVVINKGEKLNYYNPNIEGYTIKYYLDEEEFDFNSKLYGNITLKGIFIINTYTVNFYDQSHNLLETQIVEYNQNAIAPEITSNNPKLKFSSWSVSYENVKSNLDIYPLFINNEADITLDLNGGVCEEEFIYEYTNDMYDLLPIPYKEGYEFIGWYLNNTLFTKYDVVDNPIVLLAKYKANEYEIYLNTNGGNVDYTSIKINYNDLVNLPIPTKTNETFMGWYYNDTLVEMSFSYTYTRNIELVAKYSITSNVFDYVENNGNIEIINYKGKESFVEIPSIINGKIVTSLSSNIFKENYENIKELKLSPNTIKYDKGVLKNLVNLEKLWIHQTIKTTLNNLFDSKIPESFNTIVYFDIDKQEDIFYPSFYSNINKEFKFILDSRISVIFMRSDNQISNLVSFEYTAKNQEVFNISSMKYLRKIVVKGNVEKFTMDEMPKIEYVELSDYITTITHSSFKNTPNLKYVKLPKNLLIIEYDMFYNSGIEEIIIPENVVSISNNAFYNCSNLTSITIPSNVSFIGLNAFYNCKKLKNVYYNGTLESWKNITFENMYANPLYYADNLYINGELIEV